MGKRTGLRVVNLDAGHGQEYLPMPPQFLHITLNEKHAQVGGMGKRTRLPVSFGARSFSIILLQLPRLPKKPRFHNPSRRA
jgi:hypothetical protein